MTVISRIPIHLFSAAYLPSSHHCSFYSNFRNGGTQIPRHGQSPLLPARSTPSLQHTHPSFHLDLSRSCLHQVSSHLLHQRRHLQTMRLVKRRVLSRLGWKGTASARSAARSGRTRRSCRADGWCAGGADGMRWRARRRRSRRTRMKAEGRKSSLEWQRGGECVRSPV